MIFLAILIFWNLLFSRKVTPISLYTRRKIFNDEIPYPGSFCIRPRRDRNGLLDSHSPYALSYFNEDTKTKEKKTFHLQIYWNDELGYTLDNDINNTDEEPLPRLR